MSWISGFQGRRNGGNAAGRRRLNCRLCNTRSFSGGHFQGPLYFLDFRLPRSSKWGGTRKSTKIVDRAIPAPFSVAFPRPLVFLDFRLPRPPKWGELHESTKIVDFAIPAPFPEAISKTPWISWISGFQGRRNGGNPTKASKLSTPFPVAISKAACISWISAFQGRGNGLTKAPKLSILQYPAPFPVAISKHLVFS